jgi:hypothetical protein
MLSNSLTDNSLMVVTVENGEHKVYTTTRTNPRWNDILSALRANDVVELVQLMSVKNLVERYTDSNVEVVDGNVYFRGRPLHGLDVDRLLEYVRDGIPFLRLARFLERKQANPSYRSINELYKFLEYREMTLTEKGTVIGYKGVAMNYYSIMGNTATIMIDGDTDSGGHILNKVGEYIRCDRSCVCDDYRQGCSPGLHIGSLSYAKSWGPRVMIVEFDPADVVSVPDDCECQKLRACAYKVIGEFNGEVVREVPEVTSSVGYSDPDQNADHGEKNDYDAEDEDGDLEDQSCGDPNCTECNSPVQDKGIDEEIRLKNQSDSAYNDGFELGVKDGKAHKARIHLVTDLDNTNLTQMEYSYIDGYNKGYRSGRYNK